MAPRTTTDPIEILLGMGIDLDNLSEEEDYLSALKEAIAIILVKTKGAGDERSKVLLDEVVKVRKSRKAADPKFKAKKTKISADSFKRKSSVTNISQKVLPGTSKGGALVVKKTKISANDIKPDDAKEDKNILESILGSVTNIADMLKEQYKLEEKNAEKDRKSTEKTKRKLQESGLEKAFKGLAKTTQKVIAPVKSLLDKIFGFITTVLLARFLNKFIDWFADPDNRSKIKSIIRFLGDNWPKLLSAYIIFGTGLGKFSRFIVKLLARGAIRLAAATAGLLAKLFGGRALGKFSRFLGKRGKLIAGGIEAVTTIVAFKALEDSLTKGLGPEESASVDNDIPTQGYQGGGLVQPIFKFNGGGGVNLNLLAPTNNILGYEGGSYVENPGEVDGPGGIDKVPAMLTDGEFVMSRGAVQKYGVSQLEAMNASGGGTNKPKIMNGTVFAVGGGPIGDRERAPDRNLNPIKPLTDFASREIKYVGSGQAFKDLELRKQINKFFGGTFGGNFNILNPSTWKMPNIPNMNVGGIPNLNLGMPNLGIGEKVDGVLSDIKERVGQLPGMLRGVYDTIVEDPRVQSTIESIQTLKNDAIKKGIDAGYLSKDGDISGAAKAQATNFLSDLFPLVPGMSNMNRASTTKVLNNIGLSREKALGGDAVSQAMFTGASGIDRANNIGAVQINKMSQESKDYYLDKVKAGLAAGTLKSGDLITPYDLPSSHPIRREQGTVRFHVGPDGKPYFLDTYGFDPGEVELGSARAQYDNQVKKFQDPSTLKGKIAKMFDLKPMADATEGGGMAQYILAARNKLFGYDPLEEVMKGADNSMRFKNKAQIEELDGAGLGDLSRLVDQKTYEEVSILNDEEKKAFIAGGGKASLKTQSLNEVLQMGRNNIKEQQTRSKAQIAKSTPNVSIPAPPPKPAPKVVVANTGSGRDGSFGAGTSGKGRPSDDVNAANPGSGNKAKWNILGIPMPF